MALIQINGNLLNSDLQYIAHQCICTSKDAGGLAHSLFKKFPYANTYKTRTKNNEPGTIQVLGGGDKNRFIINMYAQYMPGPPAMYRESKDDYHKRRNYFFDCLMKIKKIPDVKAVGFPHNIGCGLAGGIWEDYLAMLTGLARATPTMDVVIYKLLD